MSKVLFVNACVREEKSRTLKLARAFLEAYVQRHPEDSVTERNLMKERLEPLYPETLAQQAVMEQAKQFDHPMFAIAREFVAADKLIIAAPFWELSFPAILRIYLERASAVNLTFGYDEDGQHRSFCRAEKLLFITTRGGNYSSGEKASLEMGERQMEALSRHFQIASFQCLAAENLDDQRYDAAVIMEQALMRAKAMAETF